MMDPLETWKAIMTCMETGDWAEAENNILDLREWLNKEGFPPDLGAQDIHRALNILQDRCNGA